MRTDIQCLYTKSKLLRSEKGERKNNNNTKVIGYHSSYMSFTNRLKRVDVNINLMVEKVLELSTHNVFDKTYNLSPTKNNIPTILFKRM